MAANGEQRSCKALHLVAHGPKGVQSSWTQMCSGHPCSCPCHTLCTISRREFGSDLSVCWSATWELSRRWLHTLLHWRRVKANPYHLLNCICTSSTSQSIVEKWVLLLLQRLIRHIPCISNHRRHCRLMHHFSL